MSSPRSRAWTDRARAAGVKAAREGHGPEDCPRWLRPELVRAWRSGWSEAAVEQAREDLRAQAETNPTPAAG
jgi:hypothetical protein